MFHRRGFSVLFAGLLLFPGMGQAAGNPALDTLAQGAVVQFSGKEAVSEPFVFELTIASIDKAINFALVVGQPFTMAVAPGRVVSGMIESVGTAGGCRSARAVSASAGSQSESPEVSQYESDILWDDDD